MHSSQFFIVCVLRVCFVLFISLGVGGTRSGRFGEVSGETSDLCARLGKKFQGSESQRKRIRTPTQVHMTQNNKYILQLSGYLKN